jgi:2-polyprenyl-3-methyl-5-hydroxy-6-metoxy-1,4-benzoquinol methylase
LEIGFGGGDVLSYAATKNWMHVSGLELDWRYVKFARGTLGLDVHYGDICTGIGVPAELYRSIDLLLINEVMEHVLDPVAFLAGCKRLLGPTGKIWASFALRAQDPIDSEWQYYTLTNIPVLAQSSNLVSEGLTDIMYTAFGTFR